MITRDFTNALITRLGFTVTPVTLDHFELIAAGHLARRQT